MTTDPRLASLAFALIQVLADAALACWLDRRRIHIRVSALSFRGGKTTMLVEQFDP